MSQKYYKHSSAVFSTTLTPEAVVKKCSAKTGPATAGRGAGVACPPPTFLHSKKKEGKQTKKRNSFKTEKAVTKVKMLAF